MLPSQFLALEDSEKAFIIAAINIKGERKKEEQKEIERRSKR
jgi:hypothetical protein